MPSRITRASGPVAVAAAALSLVVANPGTAHAAPGWEMRAMSVQDAHTVSKGKGVTVAVLDTGIVTDHPDLKGRATEGRDMLGDGDEVTGEPWYGEHGTSMAASVLKVAPEAEVIGHRVLRDEKDPEYSEEGEMVVSSELKEGEEIHAVAAGILESALAGADVISLSLGDAEGIFNSFDTEAAWAVDQANAQGAVVVASAGNSGGAGEDNAVSYPASLPGVISVAASTSSGSRAEFSQVHNTNDIAAPGVGIESAKNTGGREVVQGTSSAGALAAGVAALISAKYPDLAPKQITEALTATASNNGSHDPLLGYGVIDAAAALRAAGELTPEKQALKPMAHKGPAHFGDGDDGTPIRTNVELDSEYLVIGAVLGAPGLVALVAGGIMLVSGRRARRRPAA